MIEEGNVGETEAGDDYKQPLMIKGESVALFSDYPYVTQYIRDLVTEKHGEEIFSSGIKIQTFISPRLQDAAIQAVRKGVTELEMKVGKYRGPQNTILEGEKVRVISEGEKIKILSLQANQLSWQGPRLYQLYWGQVKSLSPFIADIGRQDIELGPQSYSWINPRGKWKPSESLKPGDMIRLCSTPEGFILFHEPKIQAALVAFDLETSGVIAMVGGVDYAQSQFNRAVFAKRQSGSAIKPFIYSAAIDKGFTPSTIIFDTPITLQAKGVDEVWSPKNFEEKFYGETTLRTGLVLSRNVVTVKILKDIGIDYAISYLKQFDLSTAFPRDLSLALGTGVIVPYNLFKGYGVFASYGKMFDPTLIQSIEQHGKGIIYTAKAITESVPVPDATEESPENERGVISEQTAYIITNILSEAVSNGTGWRAKVLGRPVAGKTGTSDENRDAGLSVTRQRFLCGVWVGSMTTPYPSIFWTGGTAACPIFADFMLTALGNRPVKDFRVPDGIVFTKIDAKTGRIADETSTDVRFECYKADSFPEQRNSSPRPRMTILLKEIY
jgi:penicillin-binding protein 1A